MEFKRQVISDLELWKANVNKKPLIIRGARQVGKTTLVKQFSANYKQFIHLNLEKSAHRRFFEQGDDAKDIIESLFIYYNLSMDWENTLLFIDEIQESPKAIQLLRYFYEEFPLLNVIAAGSLLEFALGKVKSFPVGRVEYLYMFPFNFKEFLEAASHERALEELNQIPLRKMAHSVLLKLFHTYAIIGGMPEVLKVYIAENSMINLHRVYESIWSTYKSDVEKYAKNDSEKKIIKHIMSSAPTFLDKRVKFQNFGNSNYRSREVGEAMRGLDEAKVIQLIYPTTSQEIPIHPDFNKAPRLQFLDTGIVNHVLGLHSQLISMGDLSSAYKGALMPHLITQELLSLNSKTYQKPNFWVREKQQSSAEVDLVIPFEDKVIPVEIKSGSTGTLRSLNQFINKAPHPYAIRIYAGEFKIDKAKTPEGTPYLLMNMPYYLGDKIFEYIEHFVKNNTL